MTKAFFKTRQFYIFLVCIILLVLTEIFIATQNEKIIKDSGQWVDHTYTVLNQADTVLAAVKDIQNNGRGFVITSKPLFEELVFAGSIKVMQQLKKLQELATDDPVQEARIDSLYPLIKNRIAFSTSYIQVKKDSGFAAAANLITLGKGIETTDKIAGIITRIQQSEQHLLETRKKKNADSITSLRFYFYLLCLLVLIVTIVLFSYTTENVKLQKEVLASSAELEKRAKKFEALLENSFEGIVLLDANLNYLYKGSSAEKVTGYAINERDASTGIAQIHPEDSTLFKENIKKIIETPGGSERILYRVLHRNGAYIWIEAITTNRLADDNVNAIVFNIRDVTARMEMDQQKDHFLSMVSHELKTPITSLKLMEQLLYQKFTLKQSEEDVKVMDRMLTQTNKIIRLINDLLDVSRFGNNQLNFNDQLISLNEIVKEEIENYQQLTHTHTIEYGNLPAMQIFADKYRVSQVVVNLLSNAVKYSPNKKKVVVEIYSEDGNAIISVQDFGIGVDAGEQEKIFDRFYRSGKDNLTTFPGFGIGLYISNEIVKNQGGKLWVNSRPGKGSVFFVSFPLA